MARVIRFHKTGGPEVLQIDEVDIDAPGPGELRRVCMRSVSTGRKPCFALVSIWSSRSCHAYGDGSCEQMLGDLRAAERFGIATRFLPGNFRGHEPENLKRIFKESLARSVFRDTLNKLFGMRTVAITGVNFLDHFFIVLFIPSLACSDKCDSEG